MQSGLPDKIRRCRVPNQLVVHVLAAFALSQNEATHDSIHEFVNQETRDVSRATVASMTRALNKAMQNWPTQSGGASKFVSTLLGEAFDGKDRESIHAADKSPSINWDNYWHIRFESLASHDFAQALANPPMKKMKEGLNTN